MEITEEPTEPCAACSRALGTPAAGAGSRCKGRCAAAEAARDRDTELLSHWSASQCGAASGPRRAGACVSPGKGVGCSEGRNALHLSAQAAVTAAPSPEEETPPADTPQNHPPRPGAGGFLAQFPLQPPSDKGQESLPSIALHRPPWCSPPSPCLRGPGPTSGEEGRSPGAQSPYWDK